MRLHQQLRTSLEEINIERQAATAGHGAVVDSACGGLGLGQFGQGRERFGKDRGDVAVVSGG